MQGKLDKLPDASSSQATPFKLRETTLLQSMGLEFKRCDSKIL